MSILWGVVVLAGVLIFRGGGNNRGGESNQGGFRGRSAMDILDERFARGEVDREEYEARKAILQSTG